MTENAFRINNRRLLLTYPQVGPQFDWGRLRDHLHGLGFKSIIGRESHADGGIHYHVYCDHGGAFQSRNARVFDVDGSHPNIEPVRNRPGTVYDYVGKDGDVVHDDTGGRPDDGPSSKRRRDDVWKEIVSAPTKDAFFELCTQMAPRELVCSFSSVHAFAEWKYRVKRSSYESPRGLFCDTGAYPELDEWVRNSIGLDSHGRYVDTVHNPLRGGGPAPPCAP